MLIEFTVTRIEDKVVGVTTSSSKYPDIPPQLPLATRKRISVSVYSQPVESALTFYQGLLRQMNS